MTLATIDYAIIVVVCFSTILSLFRGFIREAFSLLAWVVAYGVTVAYTDSAAVYLADYVEFPPVRLAVAGLGLFVATLLLGSIVGSMLTALVRVSGLGAFDRMIGVMFGLSRGVLINLALIILVPNVIPISQESWWRESALIPYFLEFEVWGTATFLWFLDFFLAWM